MAKLPDYTALGGLPNVGARPDVHIDPRVLDRLYQARAGIGNAIGNIGDKMLDQGLAWADKQQKEENALAGVRAQTDLRFEKNRALQEYETDPDYINAPKKFNDHMNEAAAKSAALIPDERARTMWRARAQSEIDDGVLHLERRGFERGRAARIEGAQGDLDRLYSIYTDPNVSAMEKDKAMEDAKQSIDLLRKQGVIDDTAAQKMHREFIGRGEADEAKTRILTDPAGVNADLKPRPRYVAPGLEQSPGLVEKGNIDLSARPRVKNEDGTTSTIRSISVNIDGKEVLLPTIADDGRRLTNEQAVQQYRETGKHLGIFDTPANATDYAKKLSDLQATKTPMEIARSMEGLDERRDRQVISSFIARSAGQNVDPARTAWCATFLNGIMGASGRIGTGSMAAKSYLNYGTPTTNPQEGDIVVLSRGDPNGPYGHVGLFVGMERQNGRDYVRVLGGNQNNKVQETLFPAETVLGFRTPPPAGSDIPPEYHPRYQNLTPLQRATLLKQSEAAMKSKDAVDKAEIKQKLDADVESMQRFGESNVVIDEQQVKDVLGPAYHRSWQESRKIATAENLATRNMPTMTEAEMAVTLRKLEPKPPSQGGVSENLPVEREIYNRASKERDRIRKVREQDPALSVQGDPEVQKVLSNNFDPNNPVHKNELTRARMTAQARVGIDQYSQSPITVDEAQKYARLLPEKGDLDPRQTSVALMQIADAVEKDWGELAPNVWRTIMTGYRIDKGVSDAMYAILEKRGSRTPVTGDDFERLQSARNDAAMRAAGDWGSRESEVGRARMRYPAEPTAAEQGPFYQPGETGPGGSAIPLPRVSRETPPAPMQQPENQARAAATTPSPVGDFQPGRSYIKPEDTLRLVRKQMDADAFDKLYGRGAASAVMKKWGER